MLTCGVTDARIQPNGWNQFDTAPGEYDVKWEDLVEKSELVMVGSSPVKTATSVDALGDVDTVGSLTCSSLFFACE